MQGTVNTNLSRKCSYRRFYCRAGVSPAIERLTHAGETPALHSEVQKPDPFGIRDMMWNGVYARIPKLLWNIETAAAVQFPRRRSK